MHVQIQNTSKFHPLRCFSQDRLRNVSVNAPTAPPLPTRESRDQIQARESRDQIQARESRDQIQARGSVMTSKLCRGTVNEGGVLRVVEREIAMPTWQAGGWETLNQYITEEMEKQLREQQAAAAAAAMFASTGGVRVQRVVDDWGALTPLQLVPPGSKVVLPLVEEKRLVIECPDDEAGLQIQNESNTRTLRLRNRDTQTGATEHVAFAAPGQVSLVVCKGKIGAVVELMPS